MNAHMKNLISKLTKVKSTSTLFNMYRENQNCRINLENYLTEMLTIQPERLIVGEAAGPYGAARTGIPFTDETILSNRPIIIGEHSVFTSNRYCILEFGSNLSNESSAQTVWSSLSQVRELPLFWNTVPFYPHKKDNKIVIRTPTDKEIRKYSSFIIDILEIHPTIKYISAIGRKAQIGVVEATGFPPYIKHPSRASSEFKTGLEKNIQLGFGKLPSQENK